MNTPTNIPFANGPFANGPDDMPDMDADLRVLMGDLDRLAAADAAGAHPELEDRLLQATLPALHGVQPIATRMAELGSIDRATAPRDLEEVVFENTISTLQGTPVSAPLVLRHTPGDARLPSTHIRKRSLWASGYVRLAASVVLVAGAAVALRTTLVSPTPASPDPTIAVKGAMETLFAVMEVHRTQDAAGSTTDTDVDELTNWLTEGVSS